MRSSKTEFLPGQSFNWSVLKASMKILETSEEILRNLGTTKHELLKFS